MTRRVCDGGRLVPKGVPVLGVAGIGKSLNAKTNANERGVSLRSKFSNAVSWAGRKIKAFRYGLMVLRTGRGYPRNRPIAWIADSEACLR